MTSFTFDDGIPAANNNPSNDQPKMLQNNISTKALIAVDHVTFDSTGSGGAGASGGQHLKVTYNDKFAPGAQTDPISISYTKNGTASPFADLYFKNQNATYLLNGLRAFCVFTATTTAGAQTILNGINVTSVVKSIAPGVTIYTINLTTNATSGTNFIPIITFSNTFGTSLFGYSLTRAANTLTLTFSNSFLVNLPQDISVSILQV